MHKARMFDVAIVGAGPSGLSCGIEAKQNGLNAILIDQGGIADAIRRYPTTMSFNSTADVLTLGGLPFNCNGMRPTRAEALRYYRSVADFFELNCKLHAKITSAAKEKNCFSLQTADGETVTARSLVLATGYFEKPVLLQVPGEELSHVKHFYDEPYQYSRSNVVVIGGANSAVDTALDLYRNGANVSIVHRRNEFSDSLKYWVKPDILNRIKEGSIQAFFETEVTEITKGALLLRNRSSKEEQRLDADFVFPLLGYRPTTTLFESLGVTFDPRSLIPQYDTSFETNVPALFLAGSTVCGCETGTVFIENGRLHAVPIIARVRERLAT